MGLRRLRTRLDHLESDADRTMGLARALLAELQDGFSVEFELTPEAGVALLHLLNGKGGKIPVKMRVIPEED